MHRRSAECTGDSFTAMYNAVIPTTYTWNGRVYWPRWQFHSRSEGCGFDSHCPGSFLRFNSRPRMSSPYCATWNKWVRLLSILKLWPIAETSVMSENDGITVRQTVAHTTQLWPQVADISISYNICTCSKLKTCNVRISISNSQWVKVSLI